MCEFLLDLKYVSSQNKKAQAWIEDSYSTRPLNLVYVVRIEVIFTMNGMRQVDINTDPDRMGRTFNVTTTSTPSLYHTSIPASSVGVKYINIPSIHYLQTISILLIYRV